MFCLVTDDLRWRYLILGISEITVGEEEQTVELLVITKEEVTTEWTLADTNTVITNSEKYTVVDEGLVHKLIIHNVEKTDARKYVCKVGTEETTGTLMVRERPVKFTQLLEDQTVQFGQDVVLVTTVNKENATVVWKKLRRPIQESPR